MEMKCLSVDGAAESWAKLKKNLFLQNPVAAYMDA